MELRKIHDYLWEIPRQGGMLVPGRIYANARMIEDLREDPALTQVANVACLPGIVGYSLAMPDIHWGYGFPIGGVAAMDARAGVISPGGVGYDINCGVRLARTQLQYEDVAPKAGSSPTLCSRRFPRRWLGGSDSGTLDPGTQTVVAEGSHWALRNGYAKKNDIEHTEEGGRLSSADPDAVSERAYKRGRKQLRHTGFGKPFPRSKPRRLRSTNPASRVRSDWRSDQVTVMIHSGSRGLGHQTCDDHLRMFGAAMAKYEISLPDRQLAAAPILSPEGQAYLGAMAAAANFAWCNRQVMMHLTRAGVHGSPRCKSTRAWVFAGVQRLPQRCEVRGSHHRWGETAGVRSSQGSHAGLRTGQPRIAGALRPLGQPVLIPGDMGRYSFVLIGLPKAMSETFGSSCHGAGRVMSRTRAKKDARGHDVFAELAALGVTVRAQTRAGVAEEMPAAYKDVAEVVEVMEAAGVTKRVARLKPFAVIKG